MDTTDERPIATCHTDSLPEVSTGGPFYRLKPDLGYTHHPLYQVIAISHGFFHVREAGTGQIKGFICSHNDACKLAIHLENKQLDCTRTAQP